MPAVLAGYDFAALWHPWVLAWVALVQVTYLLAVTVMRDGFGWGKPVSLTKLILFALGLWTVYLSEGTPVHVLSETYLFSAHMTQHILLTMIMPPLMLLGSPSWFFDWALRFRPVYWVARMLTHPAPAVLIFNLIYSVWHMPLAYQSVLWMHWFHMVQHALLVFSAFVMWMPIASPTRRLPQLQAGPQMLYIFVIGVAQIAVFGVITFADSVIYGFYANAPRVWPAVTPLVDQQLAGIIMKVGGMGIMLLVWGIVFFRWAAREGAQWGPSRTAANQ